MSDDDALSEDAPAVRLCCDVCWTEYQPQQFGAATVADVPADAFCVRCGGELCEVDAQDE